MSARRREACAAWLLLTPSLLGVTVFYLLPFAETVRRSFCDTLGQRFVGWDNYSSVLQNAAFRLAAGNTARFIATCLPLLLLLSLVLALALRAKALGAGRARDVFFTTFLLPMVLPVSAIALLWRVLFAQNGLLNAALAALGGQAVDFMGSDTAFWVLIATYLWKNIGYDSVLFRAGLGSIPKDLYEAAAVDGAGALKSFTAITLPGLVPTLLLTGILSLLNSFKVFREAYLVAGAYPQESIYLLQHLFNNWFLALDLPRLTAAAVLMAAVLLGVILAFLYLSERGNR